MRVICVSLFFFFCLNSFSQDNKRAYLVLTDPDLKSEHAFKAKRKITVWVNDSVSYSGFYFISDSLSIQIKDTIIECIDITKLKGRNKRRSSGAITVVLAPIIIGVTTDVLLLYFDDSFFTYFTVPTLAGVGGSLMGAVVALCFMEDRVYQINQNSVLMISIE